MPLTRSSGWEVEQSTSERVLEYIRTNPLLANLPVVVILEAAPGIAASNISKHLDEYALRWHMELQYMRECGDDAVGVLKSKELNVRYRYCLEHVLDAASLVCDANCKTLHPSNPPQKEIERLCEMMRSYHYDEKKHIVTSKMEGTTDDILSALNQLLYWGNVFWCTNKYFLVRGRIVQRSGFDFQFPTHGSFRPRTTKTNKRRWN